MIDKNTIFRIFEESKEKFSIKIIKRNKFKELSKYINYKEILVITGVRRSGKTYSMYYLMQNLTKKINKNNILYLNFEDERFTFLEVFDLEKILEYYYEFSKTKGKLYLFLDEIQNVPMWEKWVSRIYEKHKCIISGSNSNLLSSEISSAITGRYKEIHFYPITFKEFIDKNLSINKTEDIGIIKSKLNEYIKKGGFPESLLFNKTDLLQEYYKTILLKDVIKRYNIKYKDLIEKLAVFIASNYSKPISLYSLTKQYAAGINTIKNYLNYLEKSFLFISLNKFSYSIKKQQYAPLKYYGVDVALLESINFKITNNIGRKIENIVLIELLNNNKSIFYHKEKFECDFLIKEGLNITKAIQVTYELNEDNKKKEINGLLEALKSYKLDSGLILTYEQEDELIIDNKKILINPVWKWLLEE
jgi:uncharacterized protein